MALLTIDPRSLPELAHRYIAHRRAMGFLMEDAYLVQQLARYAEDVAPGQPLTSALALQWAMQAPGTPPMCYARRLAAARCFARFCITFDSRTEVPPLRLLGPARRRLKPHLYTPGQVRLIMARARALSPRMAPLRPLTIHTLLGLIACTGLRLGEARRLRRTDFDAKAGTLRVAPTKFSPERVLPLHPTTVRALVHYDHLRQRLAPFGEHFFVSRHGHKLCEEQVHQTFRRLTADIPGNGVRARPRIHDFRHTFATRLVGRWSRSTAPAGHRLLLLSRYLGHQCFSDTWWYVSVDPRALAAAASVFADYRQQTGSLAHERQLVPPPPAALLRGAPARRAQRERPHSRFLPRYLPPAPRLPRHP